MSISLDSLPEELIIKISDQLSLKENAALSSSTRKIKAALNENSIWKEFNSVHSRKNITRSISISQYFSSSAGKL